MRHLPKEGHKANLNIRAGLHQGNCSLRMQLLSPIGVWTPMQSPIGHINRIYGAGCGITPGIFLNILLTLFFCIGVSVPTFSSPSCSTVLRQCR